MKLTIDTKKLIIISFLLIIISTLLILVEIGVDKGKEESYYLKYEGIDKGNRNAKLNQEELGEYWKIEDRSPKNIRTKKNTKIIDYGEVKYGYIKFNLDNNINYSTSELLEDDGLYKETEKRQSKVNIKRFTPSMHVENFEYEVFPYRYLIVDKKIKIERDRQYRKHLRRCS